MTGEMRNARIFWAITAGVAAGDVVTKAIAHTRLVRWSAPREVLGDLVRITLVYNPGAAFGVHLGPHSRWIFAALAVGALGVLWCLYRAAPPADRPRVVALGLVAGGAVGNLVNRLWSPSGVVDFIDVGIGQVRWPTFNFADLAISIGAMLLAWALWDAERSAAAGAGEPNSSP